ncbi:MAG: hypothetical protein J6R04_07700, partial [Clostridia bacterium]|nr:hypothetical protein [Clostridia bacterium]
EYWKSGCTAGTGDGLVEPNIPSQYTVNDLKFTFWMYVPEADLVPLNQTESPNFEFTSDGNEDGAQLEKRFLLRDAGGLKDGWNYLEMPLSSMSASGGFDLHNINYLRWSFMCTFKDKTGTVDECIRSADFRIVATVNKGVEEQKTTVDTDLVYNIVSNAGDAADKTVALYLTEQGNVGFTWGDKQYVTSFNAMTGEWIDLALVRDMSKSKFLLYADGEVVAELDATGTKDIVPTVAHAIAADAEGKGSFNGMLADVRMWSDVRTADEIKNNRTPKRGVDNNGFDESTEGLLGSWILMGSTQDLFIKQSDVSKYHNDAVVRSSRADQWEDYVVPTDVIGEDYYTMVFIPDTQNLVTGKYTAEWLAAAQWIADNIEEENIVHVIGAGDTTWNDTISEYDRAMLGWDRFTDKVSWSNMIGNHDYPWKNNTMTIRDSTNYNTYFGEKYVKSTMGDTYFVEYYDDPYGLSKMENAYYRMEINGVPWMILQIEYHPRVCVIEWADSILKQYPDDNVILTTHGYIGNDNAAYCTHWMTYTKEDANNGGYIGSLLTPPVEWHYPALDGQNDQSNEKPIWDKLIYPNANVKMLLCGHASTTDGHVLTRWDKNAAGNIVPQTMINGQDVDETYFPNHAMGMLGILRFSADGTKCEIQYYSPYHGSSYHPSNQEMRSLTLAVNGAEQGGDVTDPEQPEDPTDPETPADPDTPGDPDTPDTPDESGSNAVLWIVIAVLAVVVIALVAVLLIKK